MYSFSVGHVRLSRQNKSIPWPRCNCSSSSEKVTYQVSIDVDSLSAPLTIDSNYQVNFFILSLTHNS